jgi:hypothetical protein
MQSPKIRAKRVGVIKDKICILKIQDTFVLSSICQKCPGTQIKAFLRLELKGEYKEPRKTKVSCIFKIQILSFMISTLFVRILG